ncbi:MAG: imidazoleglycerol phosphate synthase glutamine amidotransferase subunit HisH, partial [Flavobacteriales bacterium]
GSNGNASYEVQDSGPNSTSKMAMQFHDEESNEVQINLLSQFNDPSSNGNEK